MNSRPMKFFDRNNVDNLPEIPVPPKVLADTPRSGATIKMHPDVVSLYSVVDREHGYIFELSYDRKTRKITAKGDLDKGAQQFVKYLKAHFQSMVDGRDGL